MKFVLGFRRWIPIREFKISWNFITDARKLYWDTQSGESMGMAARVSPKIRSSSMAYGSYLKQLISHTYREVSNIRRTKYQNLNASRLIL